MNTFSLQIKSMLADLGVCYRFCWGCVMTMKNVERNCFQNSFSSHRRFNFIPVFVLLEWYGKGCIKLYISQDTWMTWKKKFFFVITPWPQSRETKLYLLTDVICYYATQSEGEHSDKVLHFSVNQCLQAT